MDGDPQPDQQWLDAYPEVEGTGDAVPVQVPGDASAPPAEGAPLQPQTVTGVPGFDPQGPAASQPAEEAPPVPVDDGHIEPGPSDPATYRSVLHERGVGDTTAASLAPHEETVIGQTDPVDLPQVGAATAPFQQPDGGGPQQPIPTSEAAVPAAPLAASRLQALRDAGEAELAGELQRRQVLAETDAAVKRELDAFGSVAQEGGSIGSAQFVEQYRSNRLAGATPGEAAGRAVVAATLRTAGAEVGLGERAIEHGLSIAASLPLSKAAPFLRKFVQRLEAGGLAAPNAGAAIGERLEAAWGEAVDATMAALYREEEVAAAPIAAPTGEAQPETPSAAGAPALPASAPPSADGSHDVAGAPLPQEQGELASSPQQDVLAQIPDEEFGFARRKDGTLLLEGDRDGLRALLTAVGVSPGAMMPAPNGILVGRTEAQRISAAIKKLQAVTAIEQGAHEAATSPLNDRPEPTEAQARAGNYKVGRVRLHGMDISIENPKGSVRRGVAPDGCGHTTGTSAARAVTTATMWTYSSAPARAATRSSWWTSSTRMAASMSTKRWSGSTRSRMHGQATWRTTTLDGRATSGLSRSCPCRRLSHG
jgi:hypothetical protein